MQIKHHNKTSAAHSDRAPRERKEGVAPWPMMPEPQERTTPEAEEGEEGGGRGRGNRAGKERRGIGRGKVLDEGERRRSSMDASVAVLSGATGSQSNG